MAELNASKKSPIADGIVITLFEDDGPTNCYNSSPLTDDEAFNLAVKSLMTIGAIDPLELGEIRSYGPIPTPKPSFQAIGFVFVLRAHSTRDSRIALSGRLIVIWIITKSTTTIKYVGMIKRMIQRLLNSYKIKTDIDFKQGVVLKNFDKKIQIIEVTQDTYYISKSGSIESFLEIALTPPNAPIMTVDHSKREIKILIQDKSDARRKIELLQLVTEFKRKLPKGTLYKAEIITEPLIVQSLLSKSGILTAQDIGKRYTIRLSDHLTFEELDNFFNSLFTQKRRQLVAQILKSYQTNTPLNLNELSNQIGLSQELIEEILESAIQARLIPNSEIKSGILMFSRKPMD